MKRQLTRVKNEEYRIIYIDETMVTRKTVADTEWSRPKENMAIDVNKLQEPTLALLCGISREKGIEHFRIFQDSVNIDKFLEYLKGVKEANQEEKVCIFMDNLSSHTSERAKTAMREHGFKFIYNVPYEPQYNPIEYVFS